MVDTSEVQNAIESLIKDQPIIKEVALRETAKHIRREAKKIVPVKEGYLKKGITYRVVRIGEHIDMAAMIRASSKDGGSKREYAQIIHEDLEANHPNGGQAKFIETPMKQAVSDGILQKTLLDAVRERFRQKHGFRLPSGSEED